MPIKKKKKKGMCFHVSMGELVDVDSNPEPVWLPWNPGRRTYFWSLFTVFVFQLKETEEEKLALFCCPVIGQALFSKGKRKPRTCLVAVKPRKKINLLM